MTCVTDNCCQGRKPCPTPRLCTDNGGARIDDGQIVGYESAGRVPDPPKPAGRDWGAIGMYCAVVVAVLFALAVICPTVPLR
jgi:hypothetical protein